MRISSKYKSSGSGGIALAEKGPEGYEAAGLPISA
jgi:hypothetical protein